jgi:hypothetical protein
MDSSGDGIAWESPTRGDVVVEGIGHEEFANSASEPLHDRESKFELECRTARVAALQDAGLVVIEYYPGKVSEVILLDAPTEPTSQM